MSALWMAVVGLLVLIGCAVGAAFDVSAGLHAWLIAALFWLGVPVGALPVVMSARLSGGVWCRTGAPVLRASLYTLPLLLLAFVPLAVGIHYLFPWTAPAETLAETVVAKLAYLNAPFFWGRLGGYFLIWLVFGGALLIGSGTVRSALGLILWASSVTFFAFDWIMSLEPVFYSAVFGLLVASGYVVMALALAVLVAGLRNGPLHGLEKVLFGAVVCWLFLDFSQYLVVWSANLPNEVTWYLHRTSHGWQWVMTGLLLCHLIAPIPVLLAPRGAVRRWLLRTVAAVLFAAQAIQVLWLTAPTFHNVGWLFIPLVPGSFIALGGLWLALFTLGLAREPEEACAKYTTAHGGELRHD